MKEPKQAIDLLLSVLASYDTNVQKRQNSYQELFGVLKENVEEVNIAHHVGQNLWKCLQILTVDITNSDQSNPCLQKAFTILSFLVHNPIICPMFSPTQVKQFFSLLFNKINADKRSCVLAVWCLGAQQFQESQLAPYLRQIFESLNLALKNPFHSQNAVSEVIKTLSNLFNRISEDDILKYSEYWMIEIMKNALNPQLPAHEKAKQFMDSNVTIQKLLLLDEEGDKTRTKLPSSLVSKLAPIASDLSEHTSFTIWKLVCAIAIPSDISTSNVNLLAQLWRRYYVHDIITAMDAWRYIIQGLSPNLNKSRINFLLKPISNIFDKHSEDGAIVSVTFKVWAFLMNQIVKSCKNPSEGVGFALNSIIASFNKIGTHIVQNFVHTITDIPKDVLAQHWRVLSDLNDDFVTRALIERILYLGFDSQFSDYLSECVTKLQHKDDEKLWLTICKAVNKLLSTDPLQLVPHTTPSNSKLNIQPLCCTIEHLLLHPLKTGASQYTIQESISVWKQLLTNTGRLLRHYNSPPIHYPDSETTMKLPIAHVDNLLDELAPHLKYMIALSDSDNEIPSEMIATYLGYILDELNKESKLMIDNRGSVAESVFSNIYEIWLLLIERNTSMALIVDYCHKTSKWSGFARFLQKVAVLPHHTDQFAQFWEIILQNYNFDILAAGFQSTSGLIKEKTTKWFTRESGNWTIPTDDQQKLHAIMPSVVPNPSRTQSANAQPKQTRFILSDTSPVPISPTTPSDPNHDSLLSIDDSPMVDVVPLLNSPMLLKSATKKMLGEKKRHLPDEPPNRESTVKKRKLSKSQYVIIEGEDLQEPNIYEPDIEKRREQRLLFTEFNPTLPSLDPSTPVEKSQMGTTISHGKEEVESLFSDLNTGCTPAKSVPPDSPVACLSVLQPKLLFEQETVNNDKVDTTEEKLSQALIEIEVADVLKTIRAAKSRFKILENASPTTKALLQANLLKIQREALDLAISCNQHIEESNL